MKSKKLPRILLNLILIMCLSFWNLSAQDLQKHKWEHRILIVKTTDENSKIYQEQLKEFKNSSEDQIERRFVLYQIIGDTYKMIDYNKDTSNKSGNITEEFLKNTLVKNKDFEIILIGLDGGIKLRQTKLLKKEELYEIVDSMPMRSSEIKRKSSSKN